MLPIVSTKPEMFYYMPFILLIDILNYIFYRSKKDRGKNG